MAVRAILVLLVVVRAERNRQPRARLDKERRGASCAAVFLAAAVSCAAYARLEHGVAYGKRGAEDQTTAKKRVVHTHTEAIPKRQRRRRVPNKRDAQADF